METSEFSAIFGVVPGFGHDDAAPEAPLERVARAWHEAAQAERARGGLYVSAALGERRVLYSRESGAPPGGEVAVEAFGACNPRCEDVHAWRESVRRVVAATRAALDQCTVRIVFRRVEDLQLEADD